jgi:ATP-binding protein involved in chromosome partitioning
MASFKCPHCHHTTDIFLSGGVEREAGKHNIPILGSVPLNQAICWDADKGKPSVVAEGLDSRATSQIFYEMAEKILKRLEIQNVE